MLQLKLFVELFIVTFIIQIFFTYALPLLKSKTIFLRLGPYVFHAGSHTGPSCAHLAWMLAVVDLGLPSSKVIMVDALVQSEHRHQGA